MRLATLALLLLSCASTLPRPNVLVSIEEVRQSPAARDAEQRAPQAYARGRQLQKRAEAAHRSGDAASAQILGEHALAAYERAVMLARLATAEARRGEVEARLNTAEKQLAALDEQQKRVLAETEHLELRARVVRDTLPLPSSAPSSPERERARLEAARALALQARLLCASARLLDPARTAVGELVGELDALEARFGKRPAAAEKRALGAGEPIDEATRLRSRCLAELSQVRRPKTLAFPAGGASDQLLEELSNAEYAPVRDDRGVVVTLRGVFGNTPALSEGAGKKLAALGRVAAAHPDFPVLVVLHTGGPSLADRDKQRLEAAVGALRTAGASRVDATLGGNAAPSVDPKRPGASERNDRLEVVFVAPTST
jgi:hypothetical protein